MAFETEKLLDETGWHLLHELQHNARLSFSELGQRVGLTSPAVAERIRKMEEAGIITGYRLEVNLPKIGLPVLGIIYLEHIGGRTCANAVAEMTQMPEVLECHRLTGSDGVILKVAATSLDHLARIIDEVAAYGVPQTSIIRSKPFNRCAITPDALAVEGDGD